MVDVIAETKTPAIIAGFGRFSSYSLNQIQKACEIDLRPFFKPENRKNGRDYHFSDKEVRFYYSMLRERSKKNGVQFTTCYIGNGEGHFWKDQDLWSNKKDCCNVKGNVKAFLKDARQISFADRLAFTPHKTAAPVDSQTLHRELGLSQILPPESEL